MPEARASDESGSIRWELHCYRSSDERDVEILSGYSYPASQAQVDAALVVLTGGPLDQLPELEAGVTAVLRDALANAVANQDADRPPQPEVVRDNSPTGPGEWATITERPDGAKVQAWRPEKRDA